MIDTMVELSFKKAATPSSNRFKAEYVAGDYSVTKEEGPFNGITWVARHKGQERANFPRLMDAKRWCSEDAEKRSQAAAAQAIEEAKDAELQRAYGDYEGVNQWAADVPVIPMKIEEAPEPSESHAKPLATPHLPNSERVQNYARQRGTTGVVTDSSPVAKLTPRQMRRVRKNAVKHGEGFTYANTVRHQRSPMGGYSLLARTPDGLGIFYQFSK